MKIVLISGPIGAGKSTTSEKLSASSPAPSSVIHGDIFWNFVDRRPDTVQDGGDAKKKLITTVISSMMSAAIPIVKQRNSTVFIDFTIPKSCLGICSKIAAAKEIPLHLVVLKPELKVCIERAATRSEGTFKPENYPTDFYEKFEGMENHTVSTEGGVDALTREILDGLEKGKFILELDKVGKS